MCGSGSLREMRAVKQGGCRGKAVSERVKWSPPPWPALLGCAGWRAVTDRVPKVREAVSGVTA
jgi:hypothetical protein